MNLIIYVHILVKCMFMSAKRRAVVSTGEAVLCEVGHIDCSNMRYGSFLTVTL